MKKWWLPYVKNKYFLTAAAFLVWMFFLNDIDLIYIMKRRAEVRNLKAQVVQLKADTEQAKESLTDLNNPATLEKFAREEYLMRKPLEDVYLVKEVKLETD
jgi:cell division protein FtsB